MPNAPVRTWLHAMTDGLADHRALLCTALPRVSPEYTVVMACMTGLVRLFQADEQWRVYLEHPFADAPELKGKKCDVVVKSSDGATRHHFEFKVLWPNGVGECIRKIRDDLRKLSALPAGPAHLVVFAYALNVCPMGLERSKYRKGRDLKWVVGRSVDKLRRTPTFESDVLVLDKLGVKGEAQLLAWSAEAGSGL